MRTVIGTKPWIKDSSLVPIPWKEGNGDSGGNDESCYGEGEIDREKRRSLRVGVMYTDGLVTPHPPVQRALRELVRKMEGIEGIELLPWDALNHELAWEFCVRPLLLPFSPYSPLGCFPLHLPLLSSCSFRFTFSSTRRSLGDSESKPDRRASTTLMVGTKHALFSP